MPRIETMLEQNQPDVYEQFKAWLRSGDDEPEQWQVSEGGQRGVDGFEITREFFPSRESAMHYYGVNDSDEWFWNNYCIEKVA